MEGDQNLRRTATLGALASVLIVAGIIVVVWLVFFRHNNSSNSRNNQTATQSQSQNGQSQGDSQSNQSGSGSSSGSSNGSGSGSSNNGSGSTQAKPAPTPQNGATNQPAQGGKGGNGQMPNTGPGDVVAVFIATSAAATGGYYLYLRRSQRAY